MMTLFIGLVTFPYFRERPRILQLLQNTLYQVLQCESEFTGTIQCVHWFLELLGHSRNIANGVMEVSKDVVLSQVCKPNIR